MPRRRSLVSILESRIRRAGVVVLLVSIVASHLTWHGRASAQDSSTWTVEEVDLSLPCFDRVTIQVDLKHPLAFAIEGPHHGVTVSSRVVQDQGASRVALTAPVCQAGHGNNTLSLRVGGDVGVTLHDSPHTRFVVSGRLASLEANLSDGSISAVEIASLDINIHGSENVAIGRLERAGQVTASGVARLTVRYAALDALSATLSDHASLQIDGGKIVALTLTTQDAASARVNGLLDTAIVTANGSGAISLPLATVSLVRHGTGSIIQSKPEPASDAAHKPINVPATSSVAPAWNALPTTNTLPAVKATPGEATMPQALPDKASHDAKPAQQSDGKSLTVTDGAAYAPPGNAPASDPEGRHHSVTVTGKAEATHGDAPQTPPSSVPVKSTAAVEKPPSNAVDKTAASTRQ